MAEAAPFIGISRHRIGIDGAGVTTLCAFHGCPLRCRYCLNPQCLAGDTPCRMLTPRQLLDEVRVDNLYFMATNGGITFGGGEPGLRSRFIEEFCGLMPSGWRITLETSLNISPDHLERLLPHVDEWIVDVKDLDPDTYWAYTGCENDLVTANLERLLRHDGMARRLVVRLPLIGGFNTEQDVDRSAGRLAGMGVERIDRLVYRTAPRQT